MQFPDVESALGSYETAAATFKGIMVPGLDAGDFRRSFADPRTIDIPGTNIPMAVPVEDNHWIRRGYFDQLVDLNGRPLYYYDGWPGLASHYNVSEDESHDHLLGQLAESGFALVFDQSSERDTRSGLDNAIARLGINNAVFPKLETTESSESGDDVYHPDHHVFIARYQVEGLGRRQEDMYASYEATYDNSGRTQLLRQIPRKDIRRTYEDYAAAFETVTRHDAMVNVVDINEYTEWMTDPRYMKMVHFDDKGIANMLVVGNVADFDWFNSGYFEQHYPQAFEDGDMVTSPDIYARPDASPMSSMHTLGLAAKVFAASGRSIYDVIECTDVSARYIPRLLEHATQRTKVAKITVGKPVLTQSVELLMVG